LSGARGTREGATYECAKCHEVFGPGAGADEGWRDEPDDDAFRFDDEDPPPETVRVPRRGRRRPPERNDIAGALDAGDEDDEPETPPAPDLEEDDEAAAPSARRKRRARGAVEEDDEPESSGVARFALRSLIGITLAYSVLSVWASTHHPEFQRLLGHIPLVGARIAELARDPGEVALRDVAGGYDYLKSGELTFVVRGRAVNLSGDPLRRVRVEGRITGAEERRHVASCTDAPADVRKASRQMLLLMETIRETRPAVLPAGGSAACDVVFVDPPPGIHELSLEVVSVLAN
jgi:hypothetical protein